VGRLYYAWLTWFYCSAGFLLFFNKLSSDRDDSFIKLPKAFSVLFAARLRIMRVLVSLSRNENNNGFDLVGLNFFSLEYKRVVLFFILSLYLVSFSWLLVL
jgi:hypothetical protein